MKLHILRIAIIIAIYFLYGIMHASDSILVDIGIAVVIAFLLDLYADNSQTFFMKKGDKITPEDLEKKDYVYSVNFDLDLEKNTKEISFTLNPRKK